MMCQQIVSRRLRRSSVIQSAAVGLLAVIAIAAGAAAPRAWAGDAPSPAAGAKAPLSVTAKLVEIPAKFPSDDLYDYAFVMKYVVVGGPLDKQTILVAHYKPKQPRSGIKDQMKKVVSGKVRSFHEGDVHKMELTPDVKSVWKGALVDEFAATDRKSVRYFALVTDPV